MAVTRIRTAFKRLSKHKNETPKSDGDNKNVVELSKDFVMIEDTTVKEENTKLDAAICKLFNYQNRTVNVGDIWISYSFPGP